MGGCLLHLDLTAGAPLLVSPYEEEAWAALEAALTDLAQRAADAPRPRPPAWSEPSEGEGDGHATRTGGDGRSRKRQRRERARARAPPEEDAAVAAWAERVAPELAERAAWWPATAFAAPPAPPLPPPAPPVAGVQGGAGEGGALPGSVAGSAPAEALPTMEALAGLVARCRVAALMLGPHNFYTAHGAYELEATRVRRLRFAAVPLAGPGPVAMDGVRRYATAAGERLVTKRPECRRRLQWRVARGG